MTAFHFHVGNVVDYLVDPAVASGKIRPGSTVGDVQASLQAMIIALSTGSPQVRQRGSVYLRRAPSPNLLTRARCAAAVRLAGAAVFLSGRAHGRFHARAVG